MKTKKKKAPSLTRLVNSCRKIASELALIRDHYRCLKCGRTKLGGWQIQASHIKPKGTYRSMSADVDNIKALCSMCHRWWHSSPTESGMWFATTFPEWHQTLQNRAREAKHWGRSEWQGKLEKLKADDLNASDE